jgi:GT2 family glycosyltransferase
MSSAKIASIDVVVLCLDRLQDTLECIDSVLAQDHPDVHLWVLDQGSGTSFINTLRQRSELDGFTFVAGKRTGVAAGRNSGYRMGQAPVIVALDNDAVLSDTGVLSRASERFAADKKLGVLAFAVLDYEAGGPDVGSWGYPWPVESHLNKEFLAARFCGAGHALSRKAFDATPGYDEQLFFFGEELDLSWALVALGYEIRYMPDIAVRHKTSKEQRIDWSNGRYYYNVRNMLYLTRKYFGEPLMLATYMGGYLFKGIRNGLTKPTLKGIWDGLRLKNQQALKPVLSKEAYDYIMQYEFTPRGSVWQRFRVEIARSLKRSGST